MSIFDFFCRIVKIIRNCLKYAVLYLIFFYQCVPNSKRREGSKSHHTSSSIQMLTLKLICYQVTLESGNLFFQKSYYRFGIYWSCSWWLVPNRVKVFPLLSLSINPIPVQLLQIRANLDAATGHYTLMSNWMVYGSFCLPIRGNPVFISVRSAHFDYDNTVGWRWYNI